MYLNIEHPSYHADATARRGKFPAFLWQSGEMEYLCKTHMRHHDDPGSANSFFGVVPFNRFVNALFWQHW